MAEAIRSGQPVAVATVIEGPGRRGARRVIWADDRATGTLGAGDRLDAAVDDDARGMLAQGLTGVRRYGAHGERRGDDLAVFVHSFAPPPRMLVFGAIDFAAAVARAGKFLGYHVTVCDARPIFATRARFPEADDVVVEWPHRYLARTPVDERTVICVLTHDPKFDVPVLEVALRTPAGYIGAMGSRRTHEDRLDRLREAGLTEAELARLRSPDRPGPGCAHARGDRGVRRRRADPAPLGWLRPAADGDLRADPSLSRPSPAARPAAWRQERGAAVPAGPRSPACCWRRGRGPGSAAPRRWSRWAGSGWWTRGSGCCSRVARPRWWW